MPFPHILYQKIRLNTIFNGLNVYNGLIGILYKIGPLVQKILY
jgi:hypothetical protein